MKESKSCFILEATDDYERGHFRIVGAYSTLELAEKAKSEMSKCYMAFIKEWKLDAKPDYYKYR